MHQKEFVWVIGNDDNRIGDARDLKRFFMMEIFGVDITSSMMYPHPTAPVSLPSSILEVLIGISKRMAFMLDVDPRDSAWELVENLRLHRFANPIRDYQVDVINEALESLVFRTYRSNGLGGFFPLRHSERDQTQLEIWYQMSDYIAENYDI